MRLGDKAIYCNFLELYCPFSQQNHFLNCKHLFDFVNIIFFLLLFVTKFHLSNSLLHICYFMYRHSSYLMPYICLPGSLQSIVESPLAMGAVIRPTTLTPLSSFARASEAELRDGLRIFTLQNLILGIMGIPFTAHSKQY